MVDLKLLCKILSDRGIPARFDSENEISIGKNYILIRGTMANFGNTKIRISDCFSLLTALEYEAGISFKPGQKNEISRIYQAELYKIIYEVEK